jgi:hypothetical protein
MWAIFDRNARSSMCGHPGFSLKAEARSEYIGLCHPAEMQRNSQICLNPWRYTRARGHEIAEI